MENAMFKFGIWEKMINSFDAATPNGTYEFEFAAICFSIHECCNDAIKIDCNRLPLNMVLCLLKCVFFYSDHVIFIEIFLIRESQRVDWSGKIEKGKK